ncbi:eCIS core domain-containing protein [Nostoc sp. WHI]|uniref:eCIS core domain-containing protein n=1 Tax=Nostoc sp. WHI TaxID=2650611 RepID=UPI0018C83485|nr:DUF4157 domain-containing protein [Nostoc sp. WHI]MBG1271391.1 DUF4157 domain-containing protein [Nostoc sp. WHI]
MSDRTFGHKKAGTSTFSNPSLVSPTTPTLANPVRGFGLPTNNVIQTATEESTNLQEAQAADEQSLLSEVIHQRSFGHDISRMALRRPQAKLTVGKPGDKYEQEADWMANQVMRMVMPDKLNAQSVQSVQDSLQRKCAACEQEEDKVQTKPSIQTATDGGLQTGNNIESRLNSSKGGGSPLSDEVRSFMEPRFGADFSQVRVHTGSEAVQMNQDLNAQAFTHKQDVYFGAGKSPAKDALTAHELTHVVQQIGIVQCQTATAGGDPECPNLLEQIRRFIFGDENTKGLIQRWEELRADPRNLQWDYWINPHPQYGSVEGHQQQFRNMQQGLRNRLNQWNSKNCDDPDGTVQLPENAWDWATRQAPVPIPRERPAPSSSRSVSVSDVIDVLVTLGLSIALLSVVIAALADPEPATKLALAGLSVVMITLLLTRLGIQSDSGGSTA